MHLNCLHFNFNRKNLNYCSIHLSNFKITYHLKFLTFNYYFYYPVSYLIDFINFIIINFIIISDLLCCQHETQHNNQIAFLARIIAITKVVIQTLFH